MITNQQVSRPAWRVGLLRGLESADSYLFRPGGAHSIAICRIALFSYLYVHVLRDASHTSGELYLTTVNLAAYYPKSLVWLLFPSAPPPGSFIDLVQELARISTICAIVGFSTRPAMIISVLTNTFLASLLFSWEPLWSHPYNSGLIAGFGFMFGRAGDVLSVDSVAARWRRKPISVERNVYWWPVILGMFGVSVTYFGGFYAKWSTPDFTYDLAWVFSDNLRNSVVLPWLIRGDELPWNVRLLVNSPFLWKLSALGHLATQALPILALFSLGRPWIRLLEGFVFVAGVFLLKAMMGMWNPQWIILAAFFVDWEFFLARVGFQFSRTVCRLNSPTFLAKRAIYSYLLIFTLLNMLIIVLRLDDKGINRLYPFSSMTFYSNVAAEKPYDKHKHYPLTYGQVVINCGDLTYREWHCYSARSSAYLPTFTNSPDAEMKAAQQTGAMHSLLARIKAYQGKTFSDCNGEIRSSGIDSIDLYSSVLYVPPYPKPIARLEVGHRALVSRYETRRDRIVAASSALASDRKGGLTIRVVPAGLEVERFEILYSNDPWKHYHPGPLIPIGGTWSGNVFEIDAPTVRALPRGWLPYVIRVHEPTGSTYDFFGGVLYL